MPEKRTEKGGDGEGKDQRSESRGQRSVRDTKNEQRVDGTWRKGDWGLRIGVWKLQITKPK